MKSWGWIVAMFALTTSSVPSSRAESLIIALSSDVVEIRSNFTGARIALFGSIQPDSGEAAKRSYDVVATTRGPRGSVTIWRKQQVGPFWLNLDQRRLIAIPSFASVLANRPLADIATETGRSAARAGLDEIVPEQTSGRDANLPSFRQALVRLRSQQGLFGENPEAVKFLSPTLFQATIPVLATAPFGKYDVDVKVFFGGAVVASATSAFTVEKGGAEQFIWQTAHNQSLLYGLATSLMALLVGWLASVIFRRD